MRGKKRAARPGRRKMAFLLFFGGYLAATAFFTWYAGEVYERTLPVVETLLPVRTGERKNGRELYEVPQACVYREQGGGRYLLTAEYRSDLMGDKYVIHKVRVWVLESADGMATVDGILRLEPVICMEGEVPGAGRVVRLAEESGAVK